MNADTGRVSLTSVSVSRNEPMSRCTNVPICSACSACSALRTCSAVKLDGFYFAQSCRLALEAAQIIQLGAPNPARAQHLHLVNDFGIGGEDTLHAVSETDFAHREAGLGAARPRNYGSFESLQALFIAFLDFHVHADSVSGIKFGQVLALHFGGKF